jgi:imidazolonepropionase
MKRKLFKNARITTPVDSGTPLAGGRQGEVRSFDPGAFLCTDGVIEAVGSENEVLRNAGEVDEEIDCRSRCLIPGFVDPHTHMCFAATREEEFSLRLAGADYLEILRQGGGILSSVRAVRTASEEELFSITAERVRSALRLGTTTLEIKSGYGLETEAELKMLRVIHRIGEETPLDVVASFLGAHAVPEEYAGAPDGYVDLVVQEMIPAVSRQGIAHFCDVFCERGVFTPEQSRRILMAAREHGLGLKIHADEIHDLGGGALAAELGAVSAEHLLAVSEESLRAMASASVTAILLPGTAYSLRKPYARARKMVDLGVPVALATDCNPGTCHTESMPFVSGLAILAMGLSPNEALVAGTLNAAYAIGMAGSAGSLEVGKAGDFLLLDGKSPAILAYRAGISPVVEVYKRGERVA